MAEKNVISKIERSVEKLLAQHRRLQQRCRDLVVERDTLKAANRALEERVRSLEADKARVELTAGLAGAGRDKTKARQRVNRLMREVDKCIALLRSSEVAAQDMDDRQDKTNF